MMLSDTPARPGGTGVRPTRIIVIPTARARASAATCVPGNRHHRAKSPAATRPSSAPPEVTNRSRFPTATTRSTRAPMRMKEHIMILMEHTWTLFCPASRATTVFPESSTRALRLGTAGATCRLQRSATALWPRAATRRSRKQAHCCPTARRSAGASTSTARRRAARSGRRSSRRATTPSAARILQGRARSPARRGPSAPTASSRSAPRAATSPWRGRSGATTPARRAPTGLPHRQGRV